MFKDIKSKIMNLGMPAKAYLALVIIAIIMNFTMKSWSSLLFIVIFATIWTCLIQYAGKHGYKSGAWVLVFLPFVFMYFQQSATMNRMMYNVKSMLSSSQPTSKTQGSK